MNQLFVQNVIIQERGREQRIYIYLYCLSNGNVHCQAFAWNIGSILRVPVTL